jgi:hypothetical protein
LKLAQVLADALPPTLTCAVCGKVDSRVSAAFSKKERKRGIHATCSSCVYIANTLKCAACKQLKMKECFSEQERDQGVGAKCNWCVEISGTIKCVACHKVKEKLSFNSWLWKNEEGKCIACCDKERQEALELEQARFRAEYERDFRWQVYLNGPQIKMPTFQVPGCKSPFDSDKRCPSVKFESYCLEESLVGKYDLIFYYTQERDESSSMNRATKGFLELEVDEDYGKLYGFLSVNRAVRSEMPFHLSCEVRICPDPETGDPIVSNIEEIISVDKLCDEVHIDIKRVTERLAVKYKPEGNCGLPKSKQTESNFLRKYYNSIQFETPEEAEEILDRYNQEARTPLLWMTNHLKLPYCLLSLVQEYAGTYKPLPILIFEKGDIFVEFEWRAEWSALHDDVHYGNWYSTSTFVARPRHLA